MRILIIGAGASGLVTAKTAREAGHEVSIVEASSAIGGTFENKRYKDGRMVSSKYLTCFSDFRSPDAEMHMSLADYVAYLRDYAVHFGILDRIRFNVKVLEVAKTKKAGTEATYSVTIQEDGDDSHPRTEAWDAVAVCSGLHNVPRVPDFPGQQQFREEILHSSEYKEPDIFKGRKVLIIGTGETAFDLGYAAATTGATAVTMSTRHGFVSVPASFGENNPPLDCVIMNWATHAWESSWAQRVRMHWWVTTKFTRMGFLLTTGSSYGFNQWVGKRYNMTWDEGRKHIVNKSAKCMPLLSRKAKKEAHWLRRWIYSWTDTEYSDIGLDIDLVEGSVARFDEESVHFETAQGPRRVEADLVLLATGYRQRFPFLRRTEGGEGEGDDPLPSEHFILDPAEPRMAYIGFIRPNVGAIPPMAEMQAMWWCQRLQNQVEEGSSLDRACYRLKGSRLCYGVDYGYYMFALAKEINAAPSLRQWLWRDWRIMLTCAFGQAHVPIFRLQGPFASAACQATCRKELYDVLWLRPVVMNLTFLVEALGFGVINGFASLLETWRGCLFTSLGLAGLVAATRCRSSLPLK